MTHARCALAAAVVLFLASCEKQPTYQTRTLSSWAYDLEAKDAFKRQAACEAMGKMGPPAAASIAAMVKLLEDPEPSVQAYCQIALGKMGPAAVQQLEPLLNRPEPQLRIHASAALVAIDPAHAQAGEVLAKAATGLGEEELAKRAQQDVVALGARGAQLMVPYLKDPYAPVRLQTIKMLGQMEKSAQVAVQPLMEQVEKGTDLEHRVAAMKALARISDRETLEPFYRGLLKDPAEEIADNAAVLLQFIGTRQGASGYEGEEAAAK